MAYSTRSSGSSGKISGSDSSSTFLSLGKATVALRYLATLPFPVLKLRAYGLDHSSWPCAESRISLFGQVVPLLSAIDRSSIAWPSSTITISELYKFG